MYNPFLRPVMNERLKRFLEMEGISPARFAETLGIQRSGVTHLLEGRNKPSFAFIQKMMTAYPELNYEWLILGKGRPYKGDKGADHTAFTVSEPELFTEPEDFGTGVEEEFTADYQELNKEFRAAQPAENPKTDSAPTAMPSKTAKKIARIIVFFNDGTYEEK